ncbi:MAG TPA: glycosyltransferase family 2 protein [Chloroflexota bacterium]|nr:glycosyltransferase family 2 protein [Chloroflexota bacterium]
MTTVSVAIPNLNGARFLPTCLDALRGQTRRPDEVIVVDDGSTDESVTLLRERYPEAVIVCHERPLGVARGFNDGVRAASGDVVVLLNNDTEAEAAWLERLARPFDDDAEVGFTASKLLLFDRRRVLHSAGDFYGRDGMPGNRGVWQEDRGQFDAAREPFGPCAAAAAYRRSLLDRLGLFDESFGSYCEDVDLSFRARLAGERCRFVPDARVYHHLSATGGGALASYHVARNALWVVIQNMPGALLARYWPLILRRQLALSAEALRHWREPAARARLRGQADAFRGLKEILARRPVVQRARRVSIPAFDALLSPPP